MLYNQHHSRNFWEEDMKTKFALVFYYISIALLIVCAIVIVFKLIFWPPCTQIGNTCTIDGWSVAGLAGTIWWTSLNKLVTKRVTKLYDKQKAEVDKTLDTQQQKIEVRIKSLQALLSPLEDKVKQSETRLETVNETLYDFEESITKSFAAM